MGICRLLVVTFTAGLKDGHQQMIGPAFSSQTTQQRVIETGEETETNGGIYRVWSPGFPLVLRVCRLSAAA